MEAEARAFDQVISDAHGVDLDKYGDFEEMRKEIPLAFGKIMDARKARAKELAHDVSDIEFSDED